MTIVTKLVVAVLKLYRLVVSPMYGQTCRYYPSCSAYALGSVETHGAGRGGWLALRRLGRCHPWCEGGVDLVPTPENYRWWGRAEGTDGEDEPGDDAPGPQYISDSPAAEPMSDGSQRSHSHDHIGA